MAGQISGVGVLADRAVLVLSIDQGAARRPVLSSTGCRYNCSYCPYRASYGHGWAAPRRMFWGRSATWSSGSASRDHFPRPLFTADRNRAVEICRGMEGVDWACETRLENIDEPLIDIMAGSGCRAIHFGIESGSDAVLAMANRSNPPFETQKRLVDYCDRRGIKVNCFFIFGLPGETEETAEETLEKAIRLNPNVAEFFVAQPYPARDSTERSRIGCLTSR